MPQNNNPRYILYIAIIFMSITQLKELRLKEFVTYPKKHSNSVTKISLGLFTVIAYILAKLTCIKFLKACIIKYLKII